MSTFNTSTRKDDLSMKLRTQNMKYTRTQTKKLEEDSRKMEERLNELKTAMSREKEERERQGGGFWDRGQMQTGSLTNYASEVLKSKPQVVPREGKKKKIKVLQDDPLDLPQRSSQPGTMKYIAQRKITSGPSPRDKQKGPKCGQCEERSATLSCVQCSEMYCAGCFAAFHLRGALKRHRSVPISASGPRVCMSPRPSIDSQSPRGSQASGSLGLFEPPPPVNGSEAAGPQSAYSTPRHSGSSLLQGDYNESESAASFQQALMAWRQGEPSPPPNASARKSSRPVASPVKSPVVSVDTGTGTVEETKVPNIKFKASLTYAEKLMLKKHRRTELAEVPTPRLQSQSESPSRSQAGSGYTSSRGSYRSQPKSGMYSEEEEGGALNRDTSFIDGEDRVNFHSLFEAVTGQESQSPERPAPKLPYPKPLSPHDAPLLSSSSTYLVSEALPLESWQTEQQYKRPTNSSTFVIDQSELPATHSSHRKLDSVSELFPSSTPTLPTPSVESEENTNICANVTKSAQKSKRPGSSQMKDTHDDPHTNGDLASTGPVNVARPKSVRAKTAKSRPVSRAKSRAQSRAASRLSNEEGVLTKAPSQALSQIARMAQSQDFVYQSPMEGFFLVGVDGQHSGDDPSTTTPTQSRPKSSSQALKSARGERESVKVSNRLYQMAPRSWRPDSSLGATIPLEDVQVAEPEPDMVLAYSYSGQLSGRATEWRPSSSQSGVDMPGDDLGLGLHAQMADSWSGSQDFSLQTSLEPAREHVDSAKKSKGYSPPRPVSGTPRRKSANRRSTNSATPVVNSCWDSQGTSATPTPTFENVRNTSGFTSSRDASFHRTKTEQRHRGSVPDSFPQSSDIPLQVKSGVPEILSQSHSQSRVNSSKAGGRLAVDLLPSKTDIVASSRSSSKSQSHKEALSSSRQGSQDPIPRPSHRGSRSREGSHLSSKNAGSSLLRHHSDVDQSQRLSRPSSSTYSTEASMQKSRQNDKNQQRPNSSTGAQDAMRSSRGMSHSVDMEVTNDTVVADMMAERVQSGVWAMHKDDSDERPSSQASHQSRQKPRRPDSGHWETEVVPFSRESVESRQSITSARENSKKRPASSRPSSTLSGRLSRAVVMEGEDLSQYDQVGLDGERDQDDEETLDRLEWELASDAGRLTADGKISHLSAVDVDERSNSRSSSRSSERSLRMSRDNDYDISAKLQEDDRLAQQDLDDFNLRRSMTLDEDDVKALG